MKEKAKKEKKSTENTEENGTTQKKRSAGVGQRSVCLRVGWY